LTTTSRRESSRKPASAAASAAKRNARPGLRNISAAAAATPESPATRRKKPKPSADTQARLRKTVLAALDDMKARDVREVDVRGKSDFADLMVVASGTSSRHVRSIADEVVKLTKRAGTPPLGVEGAEEGEWVLVDLGDVVVHVMQPRTREFYGLERLWTVGDEMPEAVGS
jgi:ribosome silencing factor RsfS/YbeB/iojap